MWGTTGIGYNVEKVKEILGTDEKPTWDVIFKPEVAAKFKDCGIHILDSPTDVIADPRLPISASIPTAMTPDDLEKAEELLLQVRPYHPQVPFVGIYQCARQRRYLHCLRLFRRHLPGPRPCRRSQGRREVDYSIPSQGAQMWFDMMAIPADAPHVAEAHEFLNYMMKPEVIAKASDYVFYANGNKASQQFISKEVIDDTGDLSDRKT